MWRCCHTAFARGCSQSSTFPQNANTLLYLFLHSIGFYGKAKQDLRIWGHFLPLQDTCAGTGTCVLVSTWPFSPMSFVWGPQVTLIKEIREKEITATIRQLKKQINKDKHPLLPVTWEKSIHYLALWQCLMPNLFPGVLLQRIRFSQQIKWHFERKLTSPSTWSGTAACSASAYTDPVCSGVCLRYVICSPVIVWSNKNRWWEFKISEVITFSTIFLAG